jgi:hypothetical protein
MSRYRDTVTDPLEPRFDLPSRRLFESSELVVSHGPLERLPSFMREGPMQSVEAYGEQTPRAGNANVPDWSSSSSARAF